MAAEGFADPRDVTRAVHLDAVIASQGDDLANYRLGSGMGRKMLADKGVQRLPHDPDLYSQFASDAAHSAVQDAASGRTSARMATYKGHLSGEHATVGDSYDIYKMRAGLDRKRRLGEAAAARRDPGTMSMLGQLVAQDAIRSATDGGNAALAADTAREAAVAGAVDTHFDTAFHLGSGELPEGVVRRRERVMTVPWPPREEQEAFKEGPIA